MGNTTCKLLPFCVSRTNPAFDPPDELVSTTPELPAPALTRQPPERRSESPPRTRTATPPRRHEPPDRANEAGHSTQAGHLPSSPPPDGATLEGRQQVYDALASWSDFGALVDAVGEVVDTHLSEAQKRGRRPVFFIAENHRSNTCAGVEMAVLSKVSGQGGELLVEDHPKKVAKFASDFASLLESSLPPSIDDPQANRMDAKIFRMGVSTPRPSSIRSRTTGRRSCTRAAVSGASAPTTRRRNSRSSS